MTMVEAWKSPPHLIPLMRLRGYALDDDGLFFTEVLGPTVAADLLSVGFERLASERVLATSETIQ